jgi:3-mercaptopyruvate sulfurtransferase SseA
LAVFVEDPLRRSGATAVYILNGGIVAWHNEGRALLNRGGATRYVHPYNDQLLEHFAHKHLARRQL